MIEESVTFMGHVPEEDKPAVYNLAKVFLIASPAELQSIAVLEAMASGLPIIAADAGALRELCNDGENGYLFKLGCHNDLAQKVLQLMSERRDLDSFGKRSRKIVENDHDTKVALRLYEAAYQGAIKLRVKNSMELRAASKDAGP
jgi:1,2-diacylglycerol 3-alpha-glucosyltransferase